MSRSDETYLFGANSIFIEELYNKYLDNPASVDETWVSFFKNIESTKANIKSDASWSKIKKQIIGVADQNAVVTPKKTPSETVSTDQSLIAKAHAIIRAYREKGHLLSNLDPLGLEVKKTLEEAALNLSHYGINEEDLSKEVNLEGKILGVNNISIKDLINLLQVIYSTTIGVELAHIQDLKQKEWLTNQFEQLAFTELTENEKKKILQDIIEVEGFEQYLHVKFPGTKRFSVEGGATSINSLETIIEASANLGVKEVVVGMAHRGRLNVLTKTMGKPYHAMLSEFQGNLAYPEEMDISGDVKYHLGTSSDKDFNGNMVHLSLAANPSHLEAVNPVVAGKVRATQDVIQDATRLQALGILIHGDAAFAGQGVVAESLSLSDLEGYNTGGIIHIVVNNQIGFTTNPRNARTGRYPTEFAKIIQAPIFHVNGDDVEAVVKVSKLAAKYRNEYKKDVVIDVVCYRLYGHNEGDEPFFTQPKMYHAIANHLTATELYSQKLKSENILGEAQIEELKSKFKEMLNKEFDISKEYKPNRADWLMGRWKGLEDSRRSNVNNLTGVPIDRLKKLGIAISTPPSDFNINNKIIRQLEAKAKMIETGENIDWGTGEALAFASLLSENIPIRLSGQDAGRGTFSHRHSVLTDQENESKYLPLNNLGEPQAKYEVIDSNLSEYGVLGFEYGYSLVDPNRLVLWEGQFGDFANGAQIMIDQFITSAETKWLRMSGLVMLLPHGYEGQGPEHSSARLERYLQLCAEDNIIVAYCSNPASYFHILRRQLYRNYRKPLIIMTPKSLLRHKLAVSKLEDFAENTKFMPVLSEVEKLDSGKVRRVILCTGKVYYDLVEERQKRNVNDIAIIRLEQLYPFAKEEIIAELNKYKNAEIIWCQEEPKNMGAWNFIASKMEDIIDNKKLKYIGRKEAASPAVGYKKIHDKEQADLVNEALTIR
ncbi:MAG: 2-oxoglutarate dehydrogenase E1 component [Alphaproteobacteria bacterium]